MILIERKDIDDLKWNTIVSNADVENIFSYTWYLDAVVDEWCALVTENYTTVLPLPFTKKMGVKQLIQAPFTREYQIIGTDFNWTHVLEFVQSNFSAVHFRCDVKISDFKSTQRKHQVIYQNQEHKLSDNAKRMIKKASQYELKKSTDVDLIIELFEKNVAHKIDSISKADIVRLRKLMQNALDLNHGELLCLYENGDCVAAAFFLKGKKTVTYLKGASTEKAKKNGAMYRLLQEGIVSFGSYGLFDFGGSEIDSVAEFYHKFGAVDRIYFEYKIDNLPKWFKLLKKLKS